MCAKNEFPLAMCTKNELRNEVMYLYTHSYAYVYVCVHVQRWTSTGSGSKAAYATHRQ